VFKFERLNQDLIQLGSCTNKSQLAKSLVRLLVDRQWSTMTQGDRTPPTSDNDKYPDGTPMSEMPRASVSLSVIPMVIALFESRISATIQCQVRAFSSFWIHNTRYDAGEVVLLTKEGTSPRHAKIEKFIVVSPKGIVHAPAHEQLCLLEVEQFYTKKEKDRSNKLVKLGPTSSFSQNYIVPIDRIVRKVLLLTDELYCVDFSGPLPWEWEE
jgi:hypothetical protein